MTNVKEVNTNKLVKKTTLLTVVCAMLMVSVGVMLCIMGYYETKIAGLESSFNEQIQSAGSNYNGINSEYQGILNKYNELTKEMDDLEEQVSNMLDGKEYCIKIEKGNETHIYEGVKKGFFIKDRHVIITTGLGLEDLE